MIGIWNDRSIWKFIITNNVGDTFGFRVIINTQRPSHLLPEILDLDGFQCRLDKFVYLWQYALLPVFKQLILLNLRRLCFKKILAFGTRMSFRCFLFDLITGIEFFQSQRHEILLDLLMAFVIRNVVSEQMQLLVVIVY